MRMCSVPQGRGRDHPPEHQSMVAPLYIDHCYPCTQVLRLAMQGGLIDDDQVFKDCAQCAVNEDFINKAHE